MIVYPVCVIRSHSLFLSIETFNLKMQFGNPHKQLIWVNRMDFLILNRRSLVNIQKILVRAIRG